MTFHKDDDMTAYQFIVPEDDNKIQTYVAEVKLNEFVSWEDEPKTPIQINNNNLSESEKTDIIKTIESSLTIIQNLAHAQLVKTTYILKTKNQFMCHQSH
jgi:hypothetical protein